MKRTVTTFAAIVLGSALAAGCASNPPPDEVVHEQASEDLRCDDVAVRRTADPLYASSSDQEAYVAGGCGRLAFYACDRVELFGDVSWSCSMTSRG